MRTHHASTTRSTNPATAAKHAAMASKGSEQYLADGARNAQRKRTIAELLDDESALEDWHRNLARLRADAKD